jgi:protein pelota
MKILKIDNKLNEIIALPETLDDLWHFEKIIDEGDRVFGKTDRKIKASKEGEKVQRQIIFVEIEVENVSFQEFSENLKVSGIILGGKPQEFVELKAHQSIDIKIGDKISVIKKQIKNWQIERLKKAEKESASARMLVILMDDEQAELAFVNQFSINKKATISSGKSGKMYDSKKGKYFDNVYEKVVSLEPNKILVVGPGFTKENFKKFVLENNKKLKIITETVNSIGETGFRELIKSGKLEGIEKELQLTKEGKIVEDFLEALGKERGIYGIKEVKEYLKNGLLKVLIVGETKLLEDRSKVEEIMDIAEERKTELHIISSKNPQERTIHNMGGVVGILYYRKSN